MHAPDYSLYPDSTATMRRARRWLLLGVAALGVAGIFAGLLANTKNPLFYTELVVHVDLSVLVWFLTIAGMLFTLALGEKANGTKSDAAFYSFALGASLIPVSAFSGGAPYMSNYIPVIYHPVFFLGLGLMSCGTSLMAGQAAVLSPRSIKWNIVHLGIWGAAIIVQIALTCFIWSVMRLPADMTGQIYYEYAFWGGGHVLQFAHSQLMMVAWLWLASEAGLQMKRFCGFLPVLLYAGPLVAFAALGIYLLYPPASDAFRQAFTLLMRDVNGLPPLILGLLLLTSFFGQWRKMLSLPGICFIMSFLLFTVGGGLGYLIAGSNLIVPAHYHGSIIGITIAFMGISYLLLPSFGFADVSRWKLAKLQPIIYGGGMLCWMIGMAILGEHGAARKTPGSADSAGKLVEFLKHGSDGLALIGGLLFVFIVLKSIYTSRKKAHEPVS